MSEKNDVKIQNFKNIIILAAIIGLVGWWVSINMEKAVSVMLALVGLGVVIFVHEFGHFIAGKLSDINVEAFAIGFGPVVIGIKKLKNFLQVRILPTLLVKDNDPQGEGLLCFKVPLNCKAGETEYQLRIFPVGGFVKLLGQEDVGADKPSDDPRSFVNKPIWKRIVVAACGVIFNVILAIAFFIVVFTIGIKMPPAIVGDVIPGMPADKAGLKAGDEITAINGKTNIDFTDVAMAAALSGRNETVNLRVKSRDNGVKDVNIEPVATNGLREFGIYKPDTLVIANLAEPNILFQSIGLKPGDKIIAAGGKKVEQSWQFTQIIKSALEKNIIIEVERPGQAEPVETHFKLGLSLANNYTAQSDADLGNIYSIVPRLQIAAVMEKKAAVVDKLKSVLNRFGIIKSSAKTQLQLLPGDIIVKFADVSNPTFVELRTLTNEYGNEYVPITVLRDGAEVAGEVKPVKEGRRFVLGILPELDVEHPVVAKTIGTIEEPPAIPSGAKIISIDNEDVSDFYDVIRIMRASAGKEIKLKYQAADSDKTHTIVFKVPQGEVGISSYLADNVPFKPLEELYKAAGPWEAVKMGSRKTVIFIVQTYITLKGLIFGTISPKSLMGPVGMIAASSKIIAERAYITYFYFMGLISACLAVMNFLPLPILDGGMVVMLIIEKIKGSPVHAKVQEGLVYVGLAIIGVLFVIITYNDILRVFFSK